MLRWCLAGVAAVLACGCGRVSFEVEPQASVAQLATHGRHSCVRFQDGSVSCWGENAYGGLGRGTVTIGGAPERVETPPVAEVAVGEYSSYAIRPTGALVAWGRNDVAQLGSGTANQIVAIPTEIPTSFEAAQVAVGELHVCVRTVEGQVACVGGNECMQLGDGMTANRSDWFVVPGVSSIQEVATHDTSVCALASDGTVSCWGASLEEQDACKGTESMPTPRPLPPIVQIEGGCHQTMCAVDIDGGVWCWGERAIGTQESATPVRVAGFGQGGDRAVEVAVGASHACARTEQQTVACWGEGPSGQLGLGVGVTFTMVPMQLTFFDGMTVDELDAGCFTTCARSGDHVFCWGENDQFEVGDGTLTNRWTPIEVALGD